jgi:FtsZ-binding cell division protein ZapB
MKSRYWAAALLSVGTWIVVGGGFLYHQMRLEGLQQLLLDDTQVLTLQGELEALRTTQAQLQTELDELANQLTTLNRDHAQLDQRLTRQQAQLTTLLNRPEDPRWQSLSLRIEQLETHTAQQPKPVASVRKTTRRPAPARSAPALPAPPLLIGVELRGPERFLAVAPAGSQTLKEVRLLRSGDRFGAWTLQRLDRQAAVFASPGQPDQTLALP